MTLVRLYWSEYLLETGICESGLSGMAISMLMMQIEHKNINASSGGQLLKLSYTCSRRETGTCQLLSILH